MQNTTVEKKAQFISLAHTLFAAISWLVTFTSKEVVKLTNLCVPYVANLLLPLRYSLSFIHVTKRSYL
jgi:hypothetical protein